MASSSDSLLTSVEQVEDSVESRDATPPQGREETVSEAAVDLIFHGFETIVGIAATLCIVLSVAFVGSAFSQSFLTASGLFIGVIAILNAMKKLIKTVDQFVD